jgi:hypothetical protein
MQRAEVTFLTFLSYQEVLSGKKARIDIDRQWQPFTEEIYTYQYHFLR